MKDRLAVFITIVCFGICTSLFQGCSGTSPRPNYYLLSAVQKQGSDAILEVDEGGILVGIGPVQFPEYVNRAQVVTRTGRNEITFSDYERWAEPLKSNFVRVLKENLAEWLNSDDIFIYPWPLDTAVEFVVTADVIRFDARPGDLAVLDLRWSLLRGSDRKVLVNKKTQYATPVPSSKYDALVAALSASLNDFSREVATAVVQNFRRDHHE